MLFTYMACARWSETTVGAEVLGGPRAGVDGGGWRSDGVPTREGLKGRKRTSSGDAKHTISIQQTKASPPPHHTPTGPPSNASSFHRRTTSHVRGGWQRGPRRFPRACASPKPVSYTHLRAHETRRHL
eukprot:2036832-Prorocentrum_lima.AAC.1